MLISSRWVRAEHVRSFSNGERRWRRGRDRVTTPLVRSFAFVLLAALAPAQAVTFGNPNPATLNALPWGVAGGSTSLHVYDATLLRLWGVCAGAQLVDFAVADTGPGIPETQLAHIREPFHESSGTAGHRIAGVGLGLAIVHRYAALLGVDVDVRSTVGVGTCFVVAVPLVTAPLLSAAG